MLRDLPLRPTARSHKANRLRLERIRKLSLFRHRGRLSSEGNSPLFRGKSIQLHKSFGFLLLGLIILRIAWRLGNSAPALPDSVGTLERRTAPLAHLALYAFQLALPLSGWALVSVSMLDIPSMPFNLFVMPDLPFAQSDAAESFWTAAHWYLAYAGIALVALHVAAALRHHFQLGDAVLTRMITPSSGREGE
ncbi:cytochrome b [Mesorhizobium sp. PAMC28654]|uniref:cytochrome b n=1 Tax=Mesorhizobium sp. PAMC28654 TaxID=2880934 RepID=UPI0039B6A9C8